MTADIIALPLPPPRDLVGWLAEDEGLLSLAWLRIAVLRGEIERLSQENAALRLALAAARS